VHVHRSSRTSFSSCLQKGAWTIIVALATSPRPQGNRLVGADCAGLPSKAMPTTDSPDTSLARHELAAWRGMLEVHARVTRQLDAQMHAEHGLSLSAYEVLMFLADAPEHRMRMSEIAERVLLSRSGCTRLVDRLVEQGYLTRHAATTDGRGLYAQLTDAGLERVNAARTTHHQGIRQFFLEHLTTTDQIALGDIWTRFHRHSTHSPANADDHASAQPAAASKR
jgi:DNA-binding MarR family transcriptional regulator